MFVIGAIAIVVAVAETTVNAAIAAGGVVGAALITGLFTLGKKDPKIIVVKDTDPEKK